MIKKILVPLLIFNINLFSSESDNSACMRCYALTCAATTSMLLFQETQSELTKCFYGLSGYQAGKIIHEKMVPDFDENNCFDRASREISRLIIGKYSLDLLHSQASLFSLLSSATNEPSLNCCLLLTNSILAHNIQKLVERNIDFVCFVPSEQKKQ